jgi:Tfp pilus assembly protein PilE
MKRSMKRQRGQALMEYIIIIVVVAIAALVVLGAFSDRLRTMIAGATNSLSNEEKVSVDKSSLDVARDLNAEGITD